MVKTACSTKVVVRCILGYHPIIYVFSHEIATLLAGI